MGMHTSNDTLLLLLLSHLFLSSLKSFISNHFFFFSLEFHFHFLRNYITIYCFWKLINLHGKKKIPPLSTTLYTLSLPPTNNKLIRSLPNSKHRNENIKSLRKNTIEIRHRERILCQNHSHVKSSLIAKLSTDNAKNT